MTSNRASNTTANRRQTGSSGGVRRAPKKPTQKPPENPPKSVSKYVSNLLTVESGGAHDERAATTINQDSDDHDAEFKAYLELMDSDGDEPRDGE